MHPTASYTATATAVCLTPVFGTIAAASTPVAPVSANMPVMRCRRCRGLRRCIKEIARAGTLRLPVCPNFAAFVAKLVLAHTRNVIAAFTELYHSTALRTPLPRPLPCKIKKLPVLVTSLVCR